MSRDLLGDEFTLGMTERKYFIPVERYYFLDSSLDKVNRLIRASM